jgi:hypothetical protein
MAGSARHRPRDNRRAPLSILKVMMPDCKEFVTAFTIGFSYRIGGPDDATSHIVLIGGRIGRAEQELDVIR